MARVPSQQIKALRASGANAVHFRQVLQNAFVIAVDLPDSEVLSRPDFAFSDGMAGAVTPGAWLSPCFEHPVHLCRFKTVRVGFSL